MMHGSGQFSVPPGFRFHPTDEELLFYYLKRKVSYEANQAIDLDVIIEVDLNKLEPWDLKEKCRIGSGPQNEWYFFSHKDKKYPAGTRTNRATAAGFWKATGRDKAIYLGNAKRIGMRKTLVFYTGRAPHGQKTDWIMHEYRLNDDDSQVQQEDGWVVCRVFKKKNQGRRLQQEEDYENPHSTYTSTHIMKPNNINSNPSTSLPQLPPRQHNYIQLLMHANKYTHSFDGGMHLPQLSSPDSMRPGGTTILSTMDNLLKLTPSIAMLNSQQLLGGAGDRLVNNGGGDWGFLDKLLAGYQSLGQHQQEVSHSNLVADDHDIVRTSSTYALRQNKLPFL